MYANSPKSNLRKSVGTRSPALLVRQVWPTQTNTILLSPGEGGFKDLPNVTQIPESHQNYRSALAIL